MCEFVALQRTPVRTTLPAARKGTDEWLLSGVNADVSFRLGDHRSLTFVTPIVNRMLADMIDNCTHISVASWTLSALCDEAYSRCDRKME